jgi:ABC-type transporter Mla subunit MlaD
MVMTIAEDMKKLTENIISSSDVRLKAVGGIVADTNNLLGGFARDRGKMAKEQTRDLADFVSGLSKDVQSLLKEAQNMLNEFHKSNSQMGKEQAKSLSDFVHKLTSEVGSTLSGFEKDRGKMSKELKDKLAREVKDIQAQVERILDEADKLVGGFNADMAQARKAWQSMSATMARARKVGFKIDAGKKVTTVGQGKKRNAKKSKSNRHPVHAGV